MQTYTVSILSQTTRQWRHISVKILSEAVQLTLGLETEWVVRKLTTGEWYYPDTGRLPYVGHQALYQAYKHTLRSLVQRWKSKHFEPVACFRMSDSSLLAWHAHFAYHL